MPLSKIADAARKRKERGGEARAQEKVALQSEVMPNLRLERNEARAKARSEARSAVTQKKLADEVAAFAAAIARVPPEEEAAHAATSSAKLLRKKSCAIQQQPQQPFDTSTEESSLVSGLAAVHRFYETGICSLLQRLETVLFEILAVQTAASQQQEHL